MHSKAHEFLKEKLKSIKAKFYRLNNGRRGEEINYSKLQDMESDWKAWTLFQERSGIQSEDRSKLHSTTRHLIKNGASVCRKDACVWSAYFVIFGVDLYKIIMQSVVGCWEAQWIQVFTHPMRDLWLHYHSLLAAPLDSKKV